MTLPISKRLEISEIINVGLRKAQKDFNFEIPLTTWLDIAEENLLGLPNIIEFDQSQYDPLNHIFNNLCKNRVDDRGQFHHFKSVEHTIEIIKNRAIQASNLLANQNNDYAEYTELYKRLNYFQPLIPEDYNPQNTIPFNPVSKSAADFERDKIFILCLTQDNHNERFWKEYGGDDSKVSIGFRFNINEKWRQEHYQFRDVFYDSGYLFEFYNEINYQLKQKYNSFLFFKDILKFSPFYKRGIYNWENETRFCIHHDSNFSQNVNDALHKIQPIKRDKASNRKYIDVPLPVYPNTNNFFNLDITEVVCGKFVTMENYYIIETLLENNYRNTVLWKRKDSD